MLKKNFSYNPKISVIVATYNCGKTLVQTIKSFTSQNYPNKELIIIDGGSKDETVSIIKKYYKDISSWKSEPDKGISDAFNKGIKVSSGNYIFFLGAGDFFWKNDVLKKIMVGVNPEKDLLVCGRINRIPANGNKVIYTSSLNFKKWTLLYKMGLPHQGLFINKKYFDKYGMFDLKCKYAMDYEILLRAYKEFPKVVLKDVIVSAWREGGIGKDKTLEIFDEYKRIKIKNKIAPTFFINMIDLASRLKYLIDN